MAAAIETENLTKDFLVGFWRPRPYRALDGLTLSVEPGEVFGFLGPNGAGKSTTLKLLMQLIYPTRRPRAHPRAARPATSAVRQRIGFLAENPYYYDYLTAEEVLTYFARLFGIRGARRRRRAWRACSTRSGIGAERRMRLRQFSKGMLQRVGLAQALINDPEVVFLDEPMSGLDPLGRRQVRDLILRLRAQGLHGVLQLAHPLRRRNAVQPGRRSWRRAAWSRPAASARWWRSSSRAGSWWSSGVTRRLQAALAPRVADDHAALARPLHARSAAGRRARAADGRAERAAAPRVVSLNPVRDTLEDYFVQQVSAAQAADTGGL